jgi:hypothetical protein
MPRPAGGLNTGHLTRSARRLILSALGGHVDKKGNAKARQNWELRRDAIRRARAVGVFESLWKRVAKNREDLSKGENFPALHSLEQSWEVLDEFYGGIVKRAGAERTGSTPFDDVMFHIEMGFYPPPELMLAVLDSYRTYLQGAGALTMEDCFFGRPRRKAGGHAQQQMTRARYILWGIEMDGLQEEGHTKIRAAEIISERFGGKPDPESIVRLVNKNYPFGRIKKP